MDAFVPPAPERQAIVVEPARGMSAPRLRRDLWEHRDLVYFLARRDVAVRYKQSIIGVFWAVLQPLLLAGVFSVFFGLLAKVPSEEGVPYPLFAASGMILWLFFASAFDKSAQSTLASTNLISKVYVPRIVIPVSAALPAVVDFCVALVVIVILTLAFGFVPGPEIVLMPVLMVYVLAAGLGIGLWFAALSVRYRDFVQLISFATLVGLFISPILYPFSLVPDNLQALYSVNPMVGALEAYRWMLLDASFPAMELGIGLVTTVVLLISGLLYFQRAERTFADVI